MGQWFMVSDDYPTLWAYQRNLPDHVPCVVLGEPEGEGVEIVKGPLTVEEAKAAIFGGMVVHAGLTCEKEDALVAWDVGEKLRRLPVRMDCPFCRNQSQAGGRCPI